MEREAPDLAVVADMEAGLEHLSWAGGTLAYVDVLLIVAEPTAKSMLTAARTNALAAQLGIAEVALVANRVTPDRRAAADAFAADQGLSTLAVLPEDPAVRQADQRGVSVLDHRPEAPIAQSLADLAARLQGRFPAPEVPV